MKAAISVVILTLLIGSTSCSLISRKSRLKNEGDKVIAKIEAFNKEQGRLPNSLTEIGIEEKLEGPIYYQKEGTSKYIVWFGMELGESVTYDSTTKEWDR